MSDAVFAAVDELWTPMRDGTRLHARAFFPPGEGPWPAIVVRTPYGLPDELPWDAERIRDAGYAVIYQNTRGRGRSEGGEAAFHVDGWGQQQDGYDTVEWATTQPWCDGRVGTWGVSAPGITQYMMAGSAPPSLICQHVGLATGNLYDHAVFQGGAYRQALSDKWLEACGFDVGHFHQQFRAHRTYDDFWRIANLEEAAAAINAPMLHWGGWYDCFIQGTLDAFTLAHTRGGPRARGRQRLVVGPWPHGIAAHHGIATFPDNCLLPPHIDPVEWFDYWIRERANGCAEAAAVQYYTMGDFTDPDAPGNLWREADGWPVPCRSTPLYLADGGRLALEPPAAAGRRSFTYDPADPVPTLGGANYLIEKGAFDQRPVEHRPDVLLFETPVLAAPLELTGRIGARLYVSSSCVDTDFTAKLSDVYPDGMSVIVHDGIVRMLFRERHAPPSPLEPGRVYAVDVDLWSTSLIVNRGHRLRLAISSSNWPRFNANPNNGDPYCDGAPVVARNSVHWGGGAPSHLRLPVVGQGPVFG